MHILPILVFVAAAIAAGVGLVLRRDRHDPLAAALVAPVLGAAAVVAAITGAFVAAVVLLAATGVLARRALGAG
jgi:uncharacterized membrane protein YkvI